MQPTISDYSALLYLAPVSTCSAQFLFIYQHAAYYLYLYCHTLFSAYIDMQRSIYLYSSTWVSSLFGPYTKSP